MKAPRTDSSPGLSSSTTYTAKVVITESGGAQSLDFYVDINGDDDYLDANEHPLSSLGEVDDEPVYGAKFRRR